MIYYAHALWLSESVGIVYPMFEAQAALSIAAPGARLHARLALALARDGADRLRPVQGPCFARLGHVRAVLCMVRSFGLQSI